MIIPKTDKEISAEMKEIVASKTGLNTMQEGSIVGAIVDTVSKEIGGLYTQLKVVQDQAYISTSQGVYTDLISELVAQKRTGYETDDELKKKAAEAVYTVAGGNKVAIDQAMSKVSGIADYEYQEYTHGPGSFTIFIYPSIGQTNPLYLIKQVKDTVEPVVSDGVFFDVQLPTGVIVDMDIVLAFKSDVSEIERRDIRNKAGMEVEEYLDDLKKNDVLVINAIVKKIMAVSENILDIGIAGLKINGKNQMVVNTFPKTNEEFRPGKIKVG